MFGFRKNKKDKILMQSIKTLVDNSIRGHDSNNDGVPDYLQRQDLPSIINSNKDFTQAEIDTTPEIEEWIMQLRGYEKNSDGKSYKSISPPIINEIGISSIKTFVITLVNKHSINNCFTEEEVHEITYMNITKFNRWLKHNYKLIGLKLSYLTSLSVQFENFTFIILLRAVEDRQRKHISERLKLTGDANKPITAFPANS